MFRITYDGDMDYKKTFSPRVALVNYMIDNEIDCEIRHVRTEYGLINKSVIYPDGKLYLKNYPVEFFKLAEVHDPFEETTDTFALVYKLDVDKFIAYLSNLNICNKLAITEINNSHIYLESYSRFVSINQIKSTAIISFINDHNILIECFPKESELRFYNECSVTNFDMIYGMLRTYGILKEVKA
ncbi:MAG: hypothetical protein IJ593_09375 [Lachnospiraceae bacterium]|nr:hypothetical protein [Lachnospiraceae bacterium]